MDDNFDIIYGSVNSILNENYSKIKKPLKLEEIVRGMIFCHQGVIIRSSLMKKEKYDLRYKICADYEFFLRIYLKEKSFKEIDTIFSNYDLNGYSNNNSILTLKETFNVVKIYKKSNLKLSIYFNYLLLREQLKYYIKRIVGDKIYIIFRQINFILKRENKENR